MHQSPQITLAWVFCIVLHNVCLMSGFGKYFCPLFLHMLCTSGASPVVQLVKNPLAMQIGYPLQYSWASLRAQMVKNPPAMRDSWVRSLGWEDPLEEGMATCSSIFSWRIPMDRGVWWMTVHGVAKSRTWLGTAQQCTFTSLKISVLHLLIRLFF